MLQPCLYILWDFWTPSNCPSFNFPIVKTNHGSISCGSKWIICLMKLLTIVLGLVVDAHGAKGGHLAPLMGLTYNINERKQLDQPTEFGQAGQNRFCNQSQMCLELSVNYYIFGVLLLMRCHLDCVQLLVIQVLFVLYTPVGIPLVKKN